MITAQTHTDALIAAVALIREECVSHNRCSECPLNGIVCYRDLSYPGSWSVDKIGVEDNE